MSENVANLRYKITSAQTLGAVVRIMKIMASSNISQYENAVRSLDDYYRTVQLGLSACFLQSDALEVSQNSYQHSTPAIGVIIFGSDQGLVGQFNEAMVAFVADTLASFPGEKIVLTVGDRLKALLAETELVAKSDFMLPNSVKAITALVGKVLLEIEIQQEHQQINQVYLFHHRPESNSVYCPTSQQLLPLDSTWRKNLTSIHWPSINLPEVMPKRQRTLSAFVREYLFVSLFRACAESLASENASRLAAMQRAEKNIDELQYELNRAFYRLRQSDIDEELFDVLSGFEALSKPVD
ncbi:F0F1 ATP synthase subunit gamma [Colwelliaceae bacterium 6471]